MYYAVGIDTETMEGDIFSLQWSYVYGGVERNGIEFCSPRTAEDTLCTFLDKLPKRDQLRAVLFVHNASFDFPAIFARRHECLRDEEFAFDSKGGWHIEGVFGNVQFARMRKGRESIQFLDTSAYFKRKLADLAQMFCPDLPKLTPPEGLGTRKFTAKDKAFCAYAMRDAQVTRIVGDNILEQHRRYSIDICVSAPHFASRVFRKHYLQQPIPLPHKGMLYASLHSYHGGKNNLAVPRGYYPGVCVVDIKSAFPYAMAQLPSLAQRDLYYSFESRQVERVPSFGVYKVWGRACATRHPVIFTHSFKPIVDRAVDGVWSTGFEINEGIRSGQLHVDRVQGYFYDAASDTNESPFRRYVEHFYYAKEHASNKIEREYNKLLLNSCYGKFKENRAMREELGPIVYDIDAEAIVENMHIVAGGMFNPFVATLITGHTRAYIHALEVQYNALHTATDGIFTEESPDRIAIGNGELGSIAIEATGDVLIVRNKTYILYANAGDERAQGISSAAFPGRIITKYALHGFQGNVLELERVAVESGLAPGKYSYKSRARPNKLRESLRRGLKVNQFQETQRTIKLV